MSSCHSDYRLIKMVIILPGTSGKTRVGLRVANFGSGACKDALTRSLSSTARRPSLRSLRLIDRIISVIMTVARYLHYDN